MIFVSIPCLDHMLSMSTALYTEFTKSTNIMSPPIRLYMSINVKKVHFIIELKIVVILE